MQRRFIVAAAFFGLTGVALGAFGTHGLRAVFEANGRAGTFQTATEYQMYHALALLGTAWISTQYPNKLIQWAGYLFITGIIIFCGSLYILSIFDLGIMGALAPVGGAAFITGWGCVGWAAWKSKEAST